MSLLHALSITVWANSHTVFREHYLNSNLLNERQSPAMCEFSALPQSKILELLYLQLILLKSFSNHNQCTSSGM